LINAAGTKATLLGSGGDKIILQGKGFEYAGGLFEDGTVTSITLKTAEGDAYERIYNFRVDAGSASGETWNELVDSIAVQVLIKNTTVIGSQESDGRLTAYNGNDIIRGRAGDDIIDGGMGNDRLSGGPGSDSFLFLANYGRDIITDFDADGGPGKQDFIRTTAYPGDAAISQVGKNTVIDFGDGDTLTLVGVKAGQIDAADFILI